MHGAVLLPVDHPQNIAEMKTLAENTQSRQWTHNRLKMASMIAHAAPKYFKSVEFGYRAIIVIGTAKMHFRRANINRILRAE